MQHGILKVYQGSLEKKEALFERNSLYLFDINITGGDMSHLLWESVKVKCEITEIHSSSQKKVWQTRLNTMNIPRYVANLVYIGGGRPKGNDTKLSKLPELEKNFNLVQWLKKRKLDTKFLQSLLRNKVMPRMPEEQPPIQPREDDLRHQLTSQRFNPWNDAGRHGDNGFKQQQQHPPPAVQQQKQQPLPWNMREESPMHAGNSRRGSSFEQQQDGFSRRPPQMSMPPPSAMQQQHRSEPMPIAPPPPTIITKSRSRSPASNEFENPIIKQAKLMLSRVMSCRAPDDPAIGDIIMDGSDVQLAMFIAKTLESGVDAYNRREGGGRQRSPQDKVGPISRPRPRSPPRQRTPPPPPRRLPPQSPMLAASVEQRRSIEDRGGAPRSYEHDPIRSDDRLRELYNLSSELRVAGQGNPLIGLPRPMFGYVRDVNAESLEQSSSTSTSLGWGTNSFLRSGQLSEVSGVHVRPPMRRESPVEFSQGTQYMEPPYKRKSTTSYYQ